MNLNDFITKIKSEVTWKESDRSSINIYIQIMSIIKIIKWDHKIKTVSRNSADSFLESKKLVKLVSFVLNQISWRT